MALTIRCFGTERTGNHYVIHTIRARRQKRGDLDERTYNRLGPLAQSLIPPPIKDDLKDPDGIQSGVPAGVPEIETIKRLRLNPGDIVVLKYPGTLSNDAYGRIIETAQEAISQAVGFEVKAILLEEGLDIDIMGPVQSIAFDY